MKYPQFAFTFLALMGSLIYTQLPALAKEASEDTSLYIRKGAPFQIPNYEVVTETADIVGDPNAGYKEGMLSWKAACQQWKTEMRDLNKENVIALNCGTPRQEKQENGIRMFSSKGTYKIKVRIKDSSGHTK